MWSPERSDYTSETNNLWYNYTDYKLLNFNLASSKEFIYLICEIVCASTFLWFLNKSIL